jgi:hypothetical protein
MMRISDSMQIQHTRLRYLALQAAFLAKLAESIEDLEDLCDDLPEEERYDPVYREGLHKDAESVAVAAACGGCWVWCAGCATCDCSWWCRWATAGCCEG